MDEKKLSHVDGAGKARMVDVSGKPRVRRRALARGRIDLPLGRSSAGRTRMAVRPSGGRAAVTEWAVEERLPLHAVVRCFPVTGRTHQIRVH